MTQRPTTVELDGKPYALELTDYSFGPQDTFRDSVTESDQPTDTLFNARGAWSRYQTSWHHGADQEIRDFLEESDVYRFDRSYGFDPWSKLGLQLLPSIRYDDDTDITADTQIITSNVYMFVSSGVNMARFSSGPNGFTSCSVSGTIQSMATDGYDLYVASTTGLVKHLASATTSTAFSTPVVGNCTKVAFVANRLLLAKSNVLYEVPASGVLGTPIITHYQAGFRWTTIFAVGSRIYAGGYIGTKSELYTFTTTEAGALVRSAEAAPFPMGEQLLCGVSAAGAVLLGTTAGVRFAQLSADGTLTYGALIDAPGEVRTIVVDGQFAYGTWNDATTSLDEGVGAFRMDLSTFVDVLQPAYAADVVVLTATEIYGIERFRGWTVLATDYAFLAAGINTDFYSEGNLSLVAGAKVQSGRLYFGTVEHKGLVQLQVRTAPLPDNVAVTGRVYDELGELVAEGTMGSPGMTELTIDLDGVSVLWCMVELEYEFLGLGYSVEQTTIYSWTIRAYPTPPQTLQWLLPINTHESVDMGEGEGATVTQGARDIIDELETLHASKRRVTYREGDREYEVRVETFSHAARQWSEDGKYPVGVCKVHLVGVG